MPTPLPSGVSCKISLQFLHGPSHQQAHSRICLQLPSYHWVWTKPISWHKMLPVGTLKWQHSVLPIKDPRKDMYTNINDPLLRKISYQIGLSESTDSDILTQWHTHKFWQQPVEILLGKLYWALRHECHVDMIAMIAIFELFDVNAVDCQWQQWSVCPCDSDWLIFHHSIFISSFRIFIHIQSLAIRANLANQF